MNIYMYIYIYNHCDPRHTFLHAFAAFFGAQMNNNDHDDA